MNSWSVCLRNTSVFVLLALVLFTACGQSKPRSPEPEAVLAILRHYPGGARIEDRIVKNDLDIMYRISFSVQTTPTQAIAYYAPLLQTLGLEENPSRGPTFDDLPVDYYWHYYGCPFHAVAMTTTAQKLLLTYTYGPCR